MATIRELIDDKIQEVFYEYQHSHNITSGDIEPCDELELDELKDELADHIQRICDKQPRAINYDDLIPSWYIYTDSDGEVHTETFDASVSIGTFFRNVSERICFGDCSDETVEKIFYKGKEIFYASWQRGMRFEYNDASGNTVWVGYYPEWDH